MKLSFLPYSRVVGLRVSKTDGQALLDTAYGEVSQRTPTESLPDQCVIDWHNAAGLQFSIEGTIENFKYRDASKAIGGYRAWMEDKEVFSPSAVQIRIDGRVVGIMAFYTEDVASTIIS